MDKEQRDKIRRREERSDEVGIWDERGGRVGKCCYSDLESVMLPLFVSLA